MQKLRLLWLSFAILNTILTNSFGLRFAIDESLDHTQVILIVFRLTTVGLIIELVNSNPLASVLLPLAMLYCRGIKDIPDTYAKCKAICKVAEEFHNKQLTIQMKN